MFSKKLFFPQGGLRWCFLFTIAMIVLCCPVVQAQTAPVLRAIQPLFLGDDKVQVTLQFDKPLSTKPKSFSMSDPLPRIVIDLAAQSRISQKYQIVSVGNLQSYVAVESDGRTRLVLNLRQSGDYQITEEGDKVIVVLSSEHGGTLKKTLSKGDVFPYTTAGRYTVSHIDFRRDADGGGRVIAKVSDPNIDVDVDESTGQILAKFSSTTMPEQLARQLDVTDFGTPVQSIETRRIGDRVEMKVNARGNYKSLAYQVDREFIIDVTPVKVDPASKQSVNPTYTGKRLSLNFQDIKVRSVLQLLAEFTGLNIVVSDAVTGNITLRLNNVPWDQALDIILRTRGLDKRQVGNVLMIGPAAELATQEQQSLQARQQVSDLEPLQSELFQMNYAKAADIAALLKTQGSSLLSTRGTATVDNRTNTLWIQETPSKLVEIQQMIQRLDVPVRQVLIEARIVNVERKYSSELGARFGLTKPNARFTGSLDAANAIANGDSITGTTVFPKRLNFDLPQALTAAPNNGRIAVALAKLGKGYLLDLELSAMESENKGEIISNPRLVTANQQAASIEAGQEIPYQEATSSGATNIAFKKAVLSLQVTPQITPDNRIVLKLAVNQDKASTLVVNGVPAIDTRHIETQVLVENGETIVLGGIFEQTKNKGVTRIPFLGQIPLVGHLFSKDNKQDDQTELLIFVTPKIIEQTEQLPA